MYENFTRLYVGDVQTVLCDFVYTQNAHTYLSLSPLKQYDTLHTLAFRISLSYARHLYTGGGGRVNPGRACACIRT